ncbi:MAG: hypothetical protein J1G38_06105 [Clostridiales bacterium]|nr:hypothetical protein [Clostridiales bacterium]
MAKKDAATPEKAKEEKKKDDKKEKGKKGKKDAAAAGAPADGQAATSLANMSPEQMTAAQIEQALKESTDPESRLKRLRSPINVRSCLLNILILIVMTLGIVILWCFLAVDKFNFGTVFSDMMSKFGISQAFEGFWNWLTGLFS